MTLRNYLIANGFQSADPAAVRTALGETVEISRNSERWYLTGIGKLIGRDALLPLLGALEATPQMKPMLYLLQTGIYLDDPETRQTIEDVRDAGVLSAEAAALLLDTGILYGPAWQKEGLSELPSTEDIKAEQQSLSDESPPEWTGETILFSANLSPTGSLVSLRVTPVGTQAGQPITGECRTIVSAKADSDERFTALLAEVRKLAEG
jgi:hypothetical protein